MADGLAPDRSLLKQDGRRSVVFLNNAYYNFFYLAESLRRRGWDALSVSVEDPNGPNAIYYHGQDLSLYDADPNLQQEKTSAFLQEVKRRFHMVHFYGIGQMSFFPALYDTGNEFDTIPEDFLALKRFGIKIGYSSGGCNQGITQSAFYQWSGGCCDRCRWQNSPEVCADRRNLAWGHKLQQMVDLHATEGNPALDYQGTDKCYREPLTTALDPDFWKPDLPVPERLRLQREPCEVLVFHAVGNFASRAEAGRNIKGTGALQDAIERLQTEGIKVRLHFVSNMPNVDLRFVQSQCDVVVDQLNYGRYGATAREAMMLGKPTICYINPTEPHGVPPSQAILECPLVSANETTIYAVLRDLVLDAEKRRAIGIQSRAFAMKWHAADACAERFEQVYDRVMRGFEPAVVENQQAYAAR